MRYMSLDDDDKEYKKKMEDMSKKMAGVKTKIAKEVQSDLEEKSKPDEDKKLKCELIYRIFHEGMEMYEEGEMSYKEFVEDLNKTLLAIE